MVSLKINGLQADCLLEYIQSTAYNSTARVPRLSIELTYKSNYRLLITIEIIINVKNVL